MKKDKVIPIAILLSLALLSLGTPSDAGAQSLFERRSMNQVDQYRHYAARHKGDLLFIVVNESTDVENRDERSLDKQGNSSNSAGFDYGFGGDVGTSVGDASFGHQTSSARNFSGDTEFRSARQFLDRFAVTVQDVLPNGNMVISGRRKVSIQGDVRELILSGIVRQYDVLPNNAVPSNQIANLQLQLEATGTEQAYSKQGWFSRNMNKLWPF